MFEEARDILAGVEEAEALWQKYIQSMGDWDNPEDVKAYRSTLRESVRESALKSLIGDSRACPACGDIVPESRRWVINKSKSVAVCRSCWFNAKGMREEIHENYSLFVNPLRRFGINGFRLRKCREVAKISLKRFARLCGWSSTYQWKLENGEYQTIKFATAETILEVLKNHGLTTEDDLYSEPDEEDSDEVN